MPLLSVRHIFLGSLTMFFSLYIAFLDENQLNEVEDDQLDALLDSLLIRIVEMLVEMSVSDIELQQELNSPDKSGFTLLHYVSIIFPQSIFYLNFIS